MTGEDPIESPPPISAEVRGAIRAATPTPAIDPGADQALRESIRSHAGFARGAPSGVAARGEAARLSVGTLSNGRATQRRLVWGSLAAAAVVGIAVIALWMQGARPMTGGPGGPGGPGAIGNTATSELATAVRLARGGGADPRVAAMLAAIVASGPAAASGVEREPGARFVALDLFVDAPDDLDGFVIDLAIDDPHGVLVGIGSGDAPFTEPPTYDAKRLSHGAIRLAAISATSATGRVRVATLSLRSDAESPSVTVTPVSAVAAREGATTPVAVTWSVLPRSQP